MKLWGGATASRIPSVCAAGLALIWAVSSPTAYACFACSGNAGDFTALSIVTWQMRELHTALTSHMALAQQGLAHGQLNGALLYVLGLGFMYGGLHALGPGHGKIALGAHAAATGEGWRGYATASLIASLAHVASAAIAVAAVLLIFKGVLSDADMMRRIMAGVAGFGLVLVGAMLLIGGGHLHLGWPTHAIAGAHIHDHAHEHRHRPSASLLSVAVASAAAPCTSSMLVLMYGAANGVLWLGLVVVGFIAIGQAVTQTGAAFAGLGLRKLFAASFGNGVLRTISGFAGAAILVAGVAALHSAIS